MLTLEELAEMVEYMRWRQSKYAATRQHDVLMLARDAERNVDEAVKEILGPASNRTPTESEARDGNQGKA